MKTACGFHHLGEFLSTENTYSTDKRTETSPSLTDLWHWTSAGCVKILPITHHGLFSNNAQCQKKNNNKKNQTHLLLFDRKRFRNLCNKKVMLRVYCSQEMEKASLLTPFNRRSSLKCLLCWCGFKFHRERWYSVFTGCYWRVWYLGHGGID